MFRKVYGQRFNFIFADIGPLFLQACVAATVVGTAVSVTSTVVETGVDVTSSVVTGTVDLITGDEDDAD